MPNIPPQGVVSLCIHPGNCLTDIMGPLENLPDHLGPGRYYDYMVLRDKVWIICPDYISPNRQSIH